jgi:heme/copper-type cytochrome/quinol oxidase subunit 4
MLIPGLNLLQTYFVIGFGLGVVLTLLSLALIALIKTS